VRRLEAQVEANLKRAKRLRQSIIARAFSGRHVPSETSESEAAQAVTAGT